jgi:tRNA threonylcarbamoyladenosine biosynthesis protein TsaB
MRLLAIETSSPAGGVALLDGSRLVGEYLLDVQVTHSERVMTAVDRLLGDARWRVSDLEGLAVSIGPGSFTGLRIGVSTAKGLAFALSLTIAPVPTLDAMAATLPFASLPVCPVLDARKDEVYCSLYRWDGLAMRRQWDYLALSPAALAARLTEPVVLVGDGAFRVDSPLVRHAPPARRLASPACVAQIGHAMFDVGAVVSPTDLVPVYRRPSEAELKRRRAVAVD